MKALGSMAARMTRTPTSKSVVSHSFFLEIEPFPTERTKCTCRGRFAQVYSTAQYKAWLEDAVKKLKALAAGRDFSAVRENTVEIDVEVYRSRPGSTKLAGPLGDNDNYEKGLWDAISKAGLWWADDRQIMDNRTAKRWSGPEQPPGYRVTITFGSEKFSK